MKKIKVGLLGLGYWGCNIARNLDEMGVLHKVFDVKKPVVGFIAGETAPAGRTMGHAGAIVGGSDDTAQAKKRIMRDCGIHVVESPAEMGKKVAEVLA